MTAKSNVKLKLEVKLFDFHTKIFFNSTNPVKTKGGICAARRSVKTKVSLRSQSVRSSKVVVDALQIFRNDSKKHGNTYP